MTNPLDHPGAPEAATEPAGGGTSRPRRLVRAILASPIAGMSPWILMSLLSGPGTFDDAAAAALGLSLALVILNHQHGSSIKPLEVFDTIYFAVMAALAYVASDAVVAWLELWAGEMSNIALVLFSLGSIALRSPFTLQYARETTPKEYWDQPLFLRTNYVITWAWTLAFLVGAVSGFIGDAVLNDPNNFWTGWIIQIGAIVFAIAFTEFYPEYGPNKAMQKAGLDTDPPRSIARLFDWLPIFVLITGISGLVTESVGTTVGVVLIVVGAGGTVLMRRVFPDPATPARGRG
jgi:hypothetical protein